MNSVGKLEITTHFYATVYRMHDAEELDELTESIKRNGLREPIVLDKHGQLIDGRNRLKACERAGVEPRFETFQAIEREGLSGEDAEIDYLDQIADFIHDKNSVRRSLSTGQKALAYALLYPPAGRGKKNDYTNVTIPEDKQKAFAVRVSEARAILEFAPGDVEAVKRGDEPFTAIAAKAKAIKKQQLPSDRRVDAIEREDAALAIQVRRGDLSIEAAEAEITVRKQRLAERRGKAIELMRQLIALHEAAADEDFPAFVQENLNDQIWRAELVKGLALNPDQLAAIRAAMGPACENLAAILKTIEGKF